MDRKHVWLGLSLFILTGCYTRVRPEVDGLVCNSVNRPVDYLPPAFVQNAAPMLSASVSPLPKNNETTLRSGTPAPPQAAALNNVPPKIPNTVFDQLLQTSAQVAAQEGKVPKQGPNLLERLQIPPEMPGAGYPAIKLPDPSKVSPEVYKAAVAKYFPALPQIGQDPQPGPGPGGRPLTLGDLQRMGRANSPVLRQVAADVTAAQGAAKQAGAYANPYVGVQSATHSASGGPTYGILMGQTISTAGKKKLAEAAAIMDLENAQLAYQRAESDLMTSIRTGYFQVLVAQESMKANRAS